MTEHPRQPFDDADLQVRDPDTLSSYYYIVQLIGLKRSVDRVISRVYVFNPNLDTLNYDTYQLGIFMSSY